MPTRIYAATPIDADGAPTGPIRLIRARSKSTARSHAARNAIRVEVANQETLVALAATVAVEDATATEGGE